MPAPIDAGCPGRCRPRLWVWVLTAMALTATGVAAADDTSPLAGRRVTAITLVGHRFTRDHVVLRELRTRVDTVLSLDTLDADVQRLDNLDIFSSIRADLAADGEDGVRVLLHLRELPPVVPYVSYDVTDQDGWSFGPAVKSVNLLGRDIYLAGYALFGGRTSYLLDLTHPWMAGDHLSLDVDVSRIVRQNDFDGFEETSTEFTPRLGTWLGRHWRAAVAVSYLRFDADLPGHTLSGSATDHLHRIGASLGFDSRDVWSNPARGWYNEVELWKTGGALGGAGDFWTVHVDGRRFEPLPAADHTLVLAGLLTLQTGTVGKDLPEYLDYHLGGANSLRGYSVDDLGGKLFGAQQLLTTVEYRVPLLPPRVISLFGLTGDIGLGGTLFVDGGLAWTDSDDLDLGRARVGAGAGLRLLIPAVDMVRLELGRGTDGWMIHFASFSKMRAQRLRLR